MPSRTYLDCLGRMRPRCHRRGTLSRILRGGKVPANERRYGNNGALSTFENKERGGSIYYRCDMLQQYRCDIRSATERLCIRHSQMMMCSELELSFYSTVGGKIVRGGESEAYLNTSLVNDLERIAGPVASPWRFDLAPCLSRTILPWLPKPPVLGPVLPSPCQRQIAQAISLTLARPHKAEVGSKTHRNILSCNEWLWSGTSTRRKVRKIWLVCGVR